MRHHQRYFSVEIGTANWRREFVAVMNTSERSRRLVRLGNERVLRARFNDARFFWDVDQQKKLADRVEDLKNVTFQAKLGSYLREDRAHDRAGKQIAEARRETRTRARAAELSQVRSHHGDGEGIHRTAGRRRRPVRAGAGRAGRSLAGHLRSLQAGEHGGFDSVAPSPGRSWRWPTSCDTLRGCFAIGMMPTGSRDPFALRRAAQGVVKIMVEGKLRIKLARSDRRRSAAARIPAGSRQVLFPRSPRLQVRRSQCGAGGRLGRSGGCGSALAGDAAGAAYREFRTAGGELQADPNILRQAQFTARGAVGRRLARTRSGSGPARRVSAHRDVVLSTASRELQAALEAIASLRPKVDMFFDKVLVNAPDERVRQNRLALLNSLLTEFSAIADFSEIVTQHS